MTYIKPEDRTRFIPILEAIESNIPESAEELNFLISSIVDICYEKSDKDYQAFNDIVGALESVKLEYYKRKVTPYVNTKKIVHGDVFKTP